MKHLLNKLFENRNLSLAEASEVMKMITSDQANSEQIAALLGALRMKGETAEEIAGFAKVLIDHAIDASIDDEFAVDVCGTGGDGRNTFNISTTVSFVVAAAGIRVAKHGNRSISSKSGSADVLEVLGVPTTLDPAQAKKAMLEKNFAFLFAPNFHPAFKNIVPVRKALGIRTVFNFLGPLVNPARVTRQVIGVFSKDLIHIMAAALQNLGSQEVMVVSSRDGLDEFSICDTTHVAHLKNGKIERYDVNPTELGLKIAELEEIKGGDAQENAKILVGILEGKIKGAPRDIVLLNSAAGLLVAGKVDSLQSGIKLANDLIDSGKAKATLDLVIGN